MDRNLYFIANSGCDATTYGLVEIDDKDFAEFKMFIENLNRNSYYGCMPVISVYKASRDDFKEINYNPKLDSWGDGYIDRDKVFYLSDKTYTFAEEYFDYYFDLECVIDGFK